MASVLAIIERVSATCIRVIPELRDSTLEQDTDRRNLTGVQ
jgi:hypothetical protein